MPTVPINLHSLLGNLRRGISEGELNTLDLGQLEECQERLGKLIARKRGAAAPDERRRDARERGPV